jgi:precorrin-2 dehydrogenase/sirohydrochlorin ferrochelatase
MPATYPLLLDVTTLKIVVVGGGAVAARKVIGLLEAGATDVTVVSPELGPDMPAVRHVAKNYAAQALAGAKVVFAATNSADVNAQVVADAKAIGALVSRADPADDGAARGDFVTPAMFKEGPVTVTVSAGSAALSAAIRSGLRESFDPRWRKMAEAMTTLRPLLRDRADLSPALRASAFRQLATEAALTVLARDGLPGLEAWINSQIATKP